MHKWRKCECLSPWATTIINHQLFWFCVNSHRYHLTGFVLNFEFSFLEILNSLQSFRFIESDTIGCESRRLHIKTLLFQWIKQSFSCSSERIRANGERSSRIQSLTQSYRFLNPVGFLKKSEQLFRKRTSRPSTYLTKLTQADFHFPFGSQNPHYTGHLIMRPNCESAPINPNILFLWQECRRVQRLILNPWVQSLYSECNTISWTDQAAS